MASLDRFCDKAARIEWRIQQFRSARPAVRQADPLVPFEKLVSKFLKRQRAFSKGTRDKKQFSVKRLVEALNGIEHSEADADVLALKQV